MAGTFVQDANATELLSSVTLSADALTFPGDTGDAVQVNAPLYVLFTLTVLDPDAANDATLQVGIQGCETSDFTTSDVVEIAWFGELDEASLVTDGATTTAGAVYQLGPICVDTKFIRAAAIVETGTAGDFTGSTLTWDAPYYQRGVHFNDSTSNDSQPSAGHKS